MGGISFDHCWNLYISDLNNNHIRKVTYNPTCNPYSHLPIDSVTLNTKNITAAPIAVYPNPANSTLTIESANKLNQIIITNVIGQTVYTQVCNFTMVEVDISSMIRGLYLVRITDEDGKTIIEKVIKE